jgi:hypothetical protein
MSVQLAVILLSVAHAVAGGVEITPPAAPPPPVPAADDRFFYAGPAGQVELTATEIAARIAADREGRHLVWQDGWPAWRDWSEVPAVKEALSHLPPPLPPPLPGIVAPPPPPPSAPPAPLGEPPAPPEALTAPAPPAAVEAPTAGAAPGCCGAHKLVRLGGEVRLNLAAAHLQNAGAEQPGAFSPTFALRRARLKADVTFGHGISGLLTADFPQNGDVTDYTVDIQGVYDRLAALEGTAGGDDTSPTVEVRDYPLGWAAVMQDAYLDWTFGGEHHRLRAGLQKPIFGTRDFFDDFGGFFLGGESAYKSLAWRAGMEDSRDLGLTYRLSPSERFDLDLQVLNGTGSGDLDDNAGKDLSARASVSLPAGLSVQASGQWGVRGQDEQGRLTQLDASLRWDVAFLRLLVDGLWGELSWELEQLPFLGTDVVAMAVLPLRSERVERLDLTARYMFFDPWVEPGEDTVPDASYIAGGGAFLHWRVGDRQRVATGVVYESLTSQDVGVAIDHTLTGQLFWYF